MCSRPWSFATVVIVVDADVDFTILVSTAVDEVYAGVGYRCNSRHSEGENGAQSANSISIPQFDIIAALLTIHSDCSTWIDSRTYITRLLKCLCMCQTFRCLYSFPFDCNSRDIWSNKVCYLHRGLKQVCGQMRVSRDRMCGEWAASSKF